MSDKVELKTWKCDACAEAENGSGLPCTLTSAFLPEVYLCPISGEECEWNECPAPNAELVDEVTKLKQRIAFMETEKLVLAKLSVGNQFNSPIVAAEAIRLRDELLSDA